MKELTVHELIASPFMSEYLVLRPGSLNGLKIPHSKYLQLVQIAEAGGVCPVWLVDAARRAWNLETSGRMVNDVVIIREQSIYGYGRASYELNLGRNYDCEHCYLGLKTFSGLSWLQRERLLHIMREAGVLWLQLTGGEPLIDKLFPAFFHVDPHGLASVCKVGRDPQIPLMEEGVEGLSRLGAIADSLLLRQGGCTGGALSGACGTCMPLVALYRKAKAPLSAYCQH